MPEFVSASGSNVDVFDGLGDSCKCSPTLAAIDNVRSIAGNAEAELAGVRVRHLIKF
jgi:hypothetical protein